jgi:hypothetical protein
VQFGLQFEAADPAAEMPASGVASTNLPASPAASALSAPASEDKDEPEKPAEGAEVVRLDRFRKK